MRDIRILLMIFVLTPLAFAHRVNIFAQVEGDSIVGQCYYSDGAPIRNQKIEVRGMTGEKLLELQTDSTGRFRFAPPVREDLRITLYAGMGHRAETIVKSADLPMVKKPQIEKRKIPAKGVEAVPKENVLDAEEVRNIVEEVVDEKFNALQESMEKQRNSISLTAVIGGIGYIFGIFGLFLYFRSKKRQ